MINSVYFSRAEFACKCGCGFDTIDATTLELVEGVRAWFNSPVRITSACRCEAHNESVGGAPTSQHLYARACDIQVQGVAPSAVADYLESVMENWGGIGRYETFTHVDSREGFSRWGE